jgi:hypothetical protein
MITSDSPTITLILKGLFLLAFEKENKFCQAGVMRAERHCLRIKIKANGTSQPIFPELPSEILDGDIFFHVSGRAGSVSIYEQKGPFDRDTSKDQRDFRWIVDLEGKEFHSRSLPFRVGTISQSIFIKNGLFYTYSVLPVLIDTRLSGARDAGVTDRIGCDIYLDDQEEAVLRYGPDPVSSIIFRKEPGISYTITLENVCEEPPESTRDSSDFVFYYDVIDVPEPKQFILLPQIRDDADARNPCVPATVGLTKAPFS